MRKLKYFIPNALTFINLLCGGLAVIYVIDNKFLVAIYLLLIAAVADLLDGLMAKLLNANSEIGKQLDSLSDLVSFGLVPTLFLYKMMLAAITGGDIDVSFDTLLLDEKLFVISSLIILLASTYRLARFNIRSSSSTEFEGLPVPANTLIIISIYLSGFISDSPTAQNLIGNKYMLLSIIIALSYLLISRIPMLSLKFKNFSLKENIWKYLLIAGAAYLFISEGLSALFFVMAYYIVLSLLKSIILSIISD